MTTELHEVLFNEIERIGRAVLSQISPLCGSRGTCVATVKAKTANVELGPNTYGRGVARGTIQDRMLVKTAFNPATEEEHKRGGAWTITPSGTSVTFTAATGGKWYEALEVGDVIRFDPKVEGLEDTAVITQKFTGCETGLIRSVAFYDEITNEHAAAFFKAQAQESPAAILGWISTVPVEGRSAGISQGATMKSRDKAAYYESFVIYNSSDLRTPGVGERRREGLSIMQAIRNLLIYRKRNDDGETLSRLGIGLEITSSARTKRDEGGWIFATQFRVSTIMEKFDPREFNKWLVTRHRMEYTRPLLENETPPAPLYGLDQKFEMPQEPES